MKRFTLIELLVVIAIIAILASMLLPALNSARAKGTAATCTGRLKQVGAYINLYTNDNKGCFLAPDSRNITGETGVERPWFDVLCAYFNIPITYEFRDRKGSFPFRCPDNASFSESGTGGQWGYGLRTCTITPDGVIHFREGIRVVNPAGALFRSWKTPSSMILAGDTVFSAKGRTAQNYSLDDNHTNTNARGIFIERHVGSGNILFGDGHTRALRGVELADEVRPNSGWTWRTRDGVAVGAYSGTLN